MESPKHSSQMTAGSSSSEAMVCPTMFKSGLSSSHNMGEVHAIYQKGDTLTTICALSHQMKIFKFKNCKNSIKMAKKTKN